MDYVIFKKKIPNKSYYHNPNITDKDGNTVAMIMIMNGIVPPI